MTDLYKKDDETILTASDADIITTHMNNIGDTVAQIDGIKAGTDYYRLNRGLKKGFTQAEINDCVLRGVDHIKLMQKESWYISDSVSRSGNAAKTKHTAAIKTGEDYIAANS